MHVPAAVGVDPGQRADDHTAAFRHPDDGHSVAGRLEVCDTGLRIGDFDLDTADIARVVIERPATIPPHKDRKSGRMVFAANSKDVDACIAAANILAYRLHEMGLKVYMIRRSSILAAIKDKGEKLTGNRDSWVIAKLNRIGALYALPDCNGRLLVKSPDFMRSSHARAALAASMVNPIGMDPWKP